MTAVREAANRFIVGIDIGGTFTDAVAMHATTGEVRVGKALTVPGREEDGAIAALEDTGVSIDEVGEIVHGHTVGLNAVLSRGGARTGLLATDGYRDLLDTGRLDRPYSRQFDLHWIRPHQERPIVPRRHRRGIRGRISAEGTELAPINLDDVRRAVREMTADGISSFAVCFMNAYLNPAHEQAVAEVIREIAPDAYVQTSDIYPLAKESERTTTVVLDAYIGPLIIDYLSRLEERLRSQDFGGPIWIMGMNGGVSAIEQSKRSPIGQLMSGPVGGVAHAVAVTPAVGGDLVTLDMGGTSTDVAVVAGGAPTHTDHWTVEWGLDLYLPMLEINTVGSGAGSIIGVDDNGKLTVGPRSAGSVPGPACYGRGGTEPALTDAFVAEGLIQPEFFFGGRMALDADAARTALRGVGERLGLGELELAAAAHSVAISHMAEAIRAISTYRGLDIRTHRLMAGGAAGPLVAARVARELGMPEVVVVRHPGQFSAFGLAGADVRVSHVSGVMSPLAAFTPESFDAGFRELEDRARHDVESQDVSTDGIVMTRSFKGMYAGQTWDNVYPVPPGPYDAQSLDGVAEAFHALYRQRTGSSSAELPIILTALQVTAVVPRTPAQDAALAAAAAGARPEPLKTVDVIWDGAPSPTPFFARGDLRPGTEIEGPAVIVEPHATTAVPPGATIAAHAAGHLLLTWTDTRENA
jgi:N-methylhydantoinase A